MFMQNGRQNEKNPPVRNELTIHLYCKWNGKVAQHSGKPLDSFLNFKCIFTVSLNCLNQTIQPRKKNCVNTPRSNIYNY